MATLIFNANRGPKAKAAKLEDFHPIRRRKPRPGMTREQLHGMRSMFRGRVTVQRR